MDEEHDRPPRGGDRDGGHAAGQGRKNQLVHPAPLSERANNIKLTQGAELVKMQGWLHDWYGIVYEPQTGSGMMGGSGIMGSMGSMGSRMLEYLASTTGAQFEFLWLRMMVAHHGMAIMQSQMAVRYASHPEPKELAASIITSQSAEIQQMVGWLKEWGYLAWWGCMGMSGGTSGGGMMDGGSMGMTFVR